MCGIAGFWGFRNDKLIKKFSQELSHRGPDGENFYIDKTVTLLNRRLAIIDRKGGRQPIYNEDQSVVVVYNGEIYNFRNIRADLEKKGHLFKTQSDTEVIVHGYEEWGERCFDTFNGMFAIALYDKKKEQLILARDHFGIKPLYYALIGTSIVFSSEIKPIFYSGLIEKKPNDRIIYRYLAYRVHDNEKETFFDGIYKLMPGEMMVVQNTKHKVQTFSTLQEELLEKKSSKKLEKQEIEQFKRQLIRSVQLRLVSEVPVGTCLSGGLDSSAVVGIANQLLKKNAQEAKALGAIQKTFSAIFPGSTNNEEHYINSLLKTTDTIKSYKVFPKPEEFFSKLQDFIKTQEEPTISTGPYAQYAVMEKAHTLVTVLLDGQGADEMLGGYIPYYFVYLRQLFEEKKYVSFLKELFCSLDIVAKLLFLKKSIQSTQLLSQQFTTTHKHEIYSFTRNNLKKRLVEDIFSNSLPSLLRYEDKNSMRFSIEGRVPFLDINLLRFIFRLPDEAIMKNGWNKYILRKAMKGILPPVILQRRNKIGFTTPEHEWFMRMKNRIYSCFLSASFISRLYFNQQAVLRAFQEYIEGKHTDTMVFWRILNVELWLREFFDAPLESLSQNRVKKGDFEPNQGKKLENTVSEKVYLRYPIRTALFEKRDDVTALVTTYVRQFLKTLPIQKKNPSSKYFIVISEKIVAIAQGRSYFIGNIHPGLWAHILSRFVTKTPYGIGLGSPWTMQLAINEVGLPRILCASLTAILTKPFGLRGVFYHIAGRKIASIDGPTEYSLYPSNVSAKLAPKNPQKVADQIHKKIKKVVSGNFLGVVIIDANDLGQTVLANSTPFSNSLVEKIFSDNPMGQSNEQTPLVLTVFD